MRAFGLLLALVCTTLIGCEIKYGGGATATGTPDLAYIEVEIVADGLDSAGPEMRAARQSIIKTPLPKGESREIVVGETRIEITRHPDNGILRFSKK